MSIDVEEYGYPRICFLGKGSIRITQGWFFPDVHPDEPATYIDLYINKNGKVLVVLDNGVIWFDFVTPLDDYLLPCSKTMTIGDLYRQAEGNSDAI